MEDEEKLFEISSQKDLAKCADNSWFKDASTSQFWLRIYTLLGVKKSEIPDKFKTSIRDLYYGTPVRINYGYLDKIDLSKWKNYVVGSDDTAPHVLLEQSTEPFPGSTCIFISTPFKVDGVTVEPNKVTKALSITATIIAAHLGKNAIRDLIYDGSVSVLNSEFSKIGTLTNIPKPHEGPNFSDFLWRGIEETITELSATNPDVKRRLEMGLDFFERGISEYDKDVRKSDALVFYWIAIESLCGGTGKIESSLQNHYRLPNRAAVQSLLGTENIRKWRNGLVHEGRTKEFTPDIDRYLQLLFLDVLRYQIGLPAICLAKVFSETSSADLSPIGLADRSAPGVKNHISRMDFMPVTKQTHE